MTTLVAKAADSVAGALERFRADTAEHQMTVLRDDGGYRHLRFKAPDRGEYWYDLHTWPGALTITGDMGTWVFKRTEDMFAFFRSEPGRVNPGYWAEKIAAADTRGAKEYDPALLKAHVVREFWEARADLDEPHLVWSDIRRDLLDWGECEHPDSARDALRSLDAEHGLRLSPEDGDMAEFEGWTFHFLWCLHAIVHGIRSYDEAKAVPQ